MNSPTVATLPTVPLLSPEEWDTDRPGLSAWLLNTMPRDLVCPILQDLSIDDIAHLAATNVLTFVAYITEAVTGTTPLSCRSVVRTMRFARANKDDENATLRALAHITCQDVRMRSSLLGQMAQALPGMAALTDGGVSVAWKKACRDACKDWQRAFDTEMPAAPSYHLEMADWQARFSTDHRTQQIANTAALNRMAALPLTLWPELMQAFAAQGVLVPGNVLTTFVDSFKECLIGISDLFATELAIALFYDDARTDIKNTLCRLGVSDRQCCRLVMPRLAECVAKATFLNGEQSLSALLRWDESDRQFNALVKAAYLRRKREG